MRVIVTGGRDYGDKDVVRSALDCLHQMCGHLTVIQGGAAGADAIAREWANGLEDVTVVTVPANWRKHRKSAGPIRNTAMIDMCRPDLVVAFPGGRGTADMVRKARAAGLPVINVTGRARDGKVAGDLVAAVETAKGIASGRIAPEQGGRGSPAE